MQPALDVDVAHRLGDFALKATFRSDGRLTALFGRSGSGKTSLVNIIGGLIRPEEGRVVVDGRPLVDTTKNLFVPKHKRRIGYVFQEARLFPHLTVRQNLLFGRWFAPRGEKHRMDFAKAVDILGVGHLLDRRPGALSGGERQRIAIGRALLADPALLLMDEPLASLDDARKQEILPYIELLRDQAGVPIVYVSHSVAEVARLSTAIVVLDNGRVAAVGPTADVLSRIDAPVIGGGPEAGAVLEAEIVGYDDAFGLAQAKTRPGLLQIPMARRRIGAIIRVRVLARDILLSLRPLEGVSALNMLAGEVRALTTRAAGGAPSVDVLLDCGGEMILARVTAKSAAALSLSPGKPVYAIVKSVSVDSLAAVSYEEPARRAEL